jgi:hypothetical protein
MAQHYSPGVAAFGRSQKWRHAAALKNVGAPTFSFPHSFDAALL